MWSGLPARSAAKNPLMTHDPMKSIDELHEALRNIGHAAMEAQQGVGTLATEIARLKRKVAALEASAWLAREGRAAAYPVEFMSQHAEDVLLWELLGPKADGFFIEAGAFDGYHLSATYALECLGWRGVLVEPLPERAAECRARRTRSRVVQAALSRRGAGGTAAFQSVADEHGGMLSYMAGQADATHAERVRKGAYATRSVTVPVTTLDEVLAGYAGPIDVAVLDVEGHEPEVLDGFDLARWKPRVLMIEDNSYGQNAALTAALAPHPYEAMFWIACNAVLIRKDDAELVERARRLTLAHR